MSMFEALDGLCPGWQTEFDVQGMQARCFDGAESLQEAFEQQFRQQFGARFTPSDDDPDATLDQKTELGEKIAEVLEQGLRYDRGEVMDMFDGGTVVSVSGNPGAMVDYQAETGYFTIGERGAIYEVPDSDSGEPMWVTRRWAPPEIEDAVLEDALYERVCDLLPSPEWGWRVSTGLTWDIVERVLDRIVGTSAEEWVEWFVRSVREGDLNDLDQGAYAIATSLGGEQAALKFLEEVLETETLPDHHAQNLLELKEAYWALWED